MESRKIYLDGVKRIIVKVGTSTLTHPSGLLNFNRIEILVRQLADMHNRGMEVILVSSGAIGAGMGRLGIKKRPDTIPEKQAAAAVGQGILMHIYEKFFSEYGKSVAQILLTREDMEHKERFENAQNTFAAILNQNVIPIVNENDAIATEEIKFGDNDTLSAIVSVLVKGDLLILLSDIDAMYDANPKENKDAKPIHFVEEITAKLEEATGGAGSNLGTGGMVTKLNAARLAVKNGISMVIADGSNPTILNDILEGEEIGTFFKRQA